MDTTSIVMKFYEKFESLATMYANQVFDGYKIGMDKDDLIQEFKIKIYTSIIAYAQKYELYKTTGRYKPVPIEMYIKSALNNKKKDLFAAIGGTPYSISIQDAGFDYSETNSMSCRLNPKECIAELNGINLVEGLTRVESKCFIMYIYGFPLKKLQKVFSSKIPDVNELISQRLFNLRQHYSALSENYLTTYKTYSLEEH